MPLQQMQTADVNTSSLQWHIWVLVSFESTGWEGQRKGDPRAQCECDSPMFTLERMWRLRCWWRICYWAGIKCSICSPSADLVLFHCHCQWITSPDIDLAFSVEFQRPFPRDQQQSRDESEKWGLISAQNQGSCFCCWHCHIEKGHESRQNPTGWCLRNSSKECECMMMSTGAHERQWKKPSPQKHQNRFILVWDESLKEQMVYFIMSLTL